jgi:hypothetical protein
LGAGAELLMTRTKWMRLVVRDPADVLRWAAEENARHLDEFRYRMIGGREYVSFRMVPRYSIDVGTREIIVVACARGRTAQRMKRVTHAVFQRLASRLQNAIGWFFEARAEATPDVPVRTAQLHQLPSRRAGSPTPF